MNITGKIYDVAPKCLQERALALSLRLRMNVSLPVRDKIYGYLTVGELKGVIVKGILDLRKTEPELFKAALSSSLNIADIAFHEKPAIEKIVASYEYSDFIQRIITTKTKISISSADVSFVGKDKGLSLNLNFEKELEVHSVRDDPLKK